MFRIRNKGSDVSQETIEDDISHRKSACISMSSLSCYCDYQPGQVGTPGPPDPYGT